MSASTESTIARGLELATRLAAASHRLHEALIAGEPTGAIRQEIVAINDAITRLAADQTQQEAEAEALQAEHIAAGAAELIARAQTRVETMMAGLEIPPAPGGRATP